MHTHRRIGAAIAAVGLAVAALPGSAFAEARASSKQSHKISTAVHRSSMTSQVPDNEYNVDNIWVSTNPKGWAKGTIKGKKGFTHKVQPAGVVLQFKHGKWKVFAIGGTGLGCDVPTKVAHDLKLGGCAY